MVSFNHQWWKHLAPKVMHRKRAEINSLLQRWCRTEYGTFWLDAVLREHGVIRVKVGQIIPVLHMIALGDEPIFVVPPTRSRQGHRMVGPDDFQSGQELEEGEMALQPTIRLDVVLDRTLLAAAARCDTSVHIPGVKEPSIVFSAPAKVLLAPNRSPNRAYVLYQHIFGEGNSYPDDGYFYVGVTTRSWKARWAEHRRAVKAGSPLLFHRKLREEMSAGRVTYIHHKVMGITSDIEMLYSAEERLVEGHWSDARRLNMIPGGKAGLKYLRENGMLAERAIPLPDQRDRIVSTWLREHPRKGLPAPWVAEKWKDENWAVAQICGRENRLSVEQVRAIRKLAEAHSAKIIAERIGALNADQVQRVIDGKTYMRVT